MTISNITTEDLQSWAGERSFERGQTYVEENRVRSLQERDGKISATVTGTHNYRVKLWTKRDPIEYTCDCPVGRRGDFCKHCVATALAWMETHAQSGKDTTKKRSHAKKGKTELTQQDMHAWLLQQEKQHLVEMLLDAAGEDETLHNRIMLKAASDKHVNLTTYKKIINQAINTGGFVDYHHMYDYWRGVETAIDAITELLDQGHAEAVIKLSEHALTRLEKAIEHVDDSDGYMSILINHMQNLHFTACCKAPPDTKALAKRLFQRELNSAWDIFSDAIITYSEVLGETGVQSYRKLAEKEWRKIKPLQPGDDDSERYGTRFRITRIMENLARQSGDIEELIAIKQNDLSSSYCYLDIANTYRAARQEDKALEWAEQGIQIFGKEVDDRLRDLLADLYHQRKRHHEAMELIWPQFERHPYLSNYQKLKTHADINKSWSEWREKALTYLRKHIDAARQKQSDSRWRYIHREDNSTLVEIFLWENKAEAAWQEAQQGGCSEGLWLKLAQLREKKYPRDAIAIYRKRIAPLVEQTNNAAYAEATDMLIKIDALMQKLGEQITFQQYLDELRIKYKRKRNFIKLLDKSW